MWLESINNKQEQIIPFVHTTIVTFHILEYYYHSIIVADKKGQYYDLNITRVFCYNIMMPISGFLSKFAFNYDRLIFLNTSVI